MLGERKSACVLVQPQKKNPPAKLATWGGRNTSESQIKYEDKHVFVHIFGGRRRSWSLVPAMELEPRERFRQRGVSGFWKRRA